MVRVVFSVVISVDVAIFPDAVYVVAVDPMVFRSFQYMAPTLQNQLPVKDITVY